MVEYCLSGQDRLWFAIVVILALVGLMHVVHGLLSELRARFPHWFRWWSE